MWQFVIVKNKLMSVFIASVLIDNIFRHHIVSPLGYRLADPQLLWQCDDEIHDQQQDRRIKNWRQFVKSTTLSEISWNKLKWEIFCSFILISYDTRETAKRREMKPWVFQLLAAVETFAENVKTFHLRESCFREVTSGYPKFSSFFMKLAASVQKLVHKLCMFVKALQKPAT